MPCGGPQLYDFVRTTGEAFFQREQKCLEFA